MRNARNKIIYWVSTGLLTAISLFTVSMYTFLHEAMIETFQNLGYPAYMIYPLGLAKILGLLAIWTRKSETLKQLAYAGFLLDAFLALTAHWMVQDGNYWLAALAILVVVVSFIYDNKVFGSNISGSVFRRLHIRHNRLSHGG